MRISSLAGLPAVLRSLGADVAGLLAEVGIETSLFDDPDNRIGYAARSRLLDHCAARTGCPHLGLLVGQQGQLQHLGLVGLLAKYSPDAGAALRSLVRHFHLHARGVSLSLTVDDDVATLGYTIHLPHTVATDQVGDGAAAMMLNVMRSLCGPDWAPAEVLLAHRRPADGRPYRQVFRAPLRFDAECNGLTFPAHWLSHPLPLADPDLGRLLQRQIDALETMAVRPLQYVVMPKLLAGIRRSPLFGPSEAELVLLPASPGIDFLFAFDEGFELFSHLGSFQALLK